MRLNEPISPHEYLVPVDRPLVSVTDLKGRITHCNPAFVEASGFRREELMGQPHNLVRHPDMPEEAFRDLWATIESGRPWTGLVKNRRKNGDFYWVHANATPMRDGDRIVGYLSVRGAPDRNAVQAAEALYATLRQQAAQGALRQRLEQGRVVRADTAGRLLQALVPGPRGCTGLLLAVCAAVPAAAVSAFGAWGWLALPMVVAGTGRLLSARTFGALRGVLDDANRLAAGDLSRSVTTGAPGLAGELQQALAQMAVNLRTVIADTRSEIANVRSAAHEIAAGNRDLSERTESQASSLEQAAASMAQINETVRANADAASAGARQATQTASTTRGGNDAVQAVAQTMDEIRASSQRIGQIIGVVEAVAFQTNLLALNAAVEAARAGPAGRGFAVVAGEVRALAQRASGSAREVTALVNASAACVETGSRRVADARARMDGVLADVGEVSGTLGTIEAAAQAQQRGIEQVNDAVAHMDGITQQNAAMVEQLAAAAASLDSQVEVVDSALRIFRLREGERSVAEADAVALRRAVREGVPEPA